MTAKQFFKRQINFEEMELPPILYKYRDWQNPFHKSILISRQLWLAQPSSFKDELDCKIPVRYDLLTEEDMYLMYLHSAKEMYPNWNFKQQEIFARAWAKKSPTKNKKNIEQAKVKFFDDFDCRFGVLSLTGNPKSDAMWSEYGANHAGFCVGYDPKIAFKSLGGGGQVNYLEELPIIKPRPFHDYDEQHTLQVFSKLEKWKFEEEYRGHKFRKEPYTNQHRILTLPSEAHVEIIFGAKISDENKREIENLVRSTMPHVRLFQAQLNNEKLMLQLI